MERIFRGTTLAWQNTGEATAAGFDSTAEDLENSHICIEKIVWTDEKMENVEKTKYVMKVSRGKQCRARVGPGLQISTTSYKESSGGTCYITHSLALAT